MEAKIRSYLAHWTVVVPVVAIAALVLTWGRDLPPPAVIIVALLLGGAVLAAVHHAEVVAHRVGEPFGSLVLAVAVTIIEVALIVTLMISGGEKTQSLARDTVFAAVMITCNGLLGLSLLVGAARRHVAVFNPEGTGGAFATVIMIATLSLVLPRPWSASRSPCWCCCPRRSPRPARPPATASRPASTWRSARRWPASASPFRPSPSR